MTTTEPIYLDHAATTPLRQEVRDAMDPFLNSVFGNPSSVHRWGRAAAAGLEDARAQAAEAIGARPSEIHFVRGGTESDNLAVRGRCRWLGTGGPTPTLIISAVEHHAVLEAGEAAEAEGEVHLERVAIDAEGALDWDALGRGLARGPSVASFMWVNNETGLVLPLAEVADRCHAAGATLHTDAVQAIGKIPLDVRDVPVDLLSITGHKIYGPRGSAILYVRSGTPLSPLLHGGGQERALRPGTEDVAGAVALATAMRLAAVEQPAEATRLSGLRDRLEMGLIDRIPSIRINAGRAPRAAHISSVGIDGLDGRSLVMALDLEGVAVSGGSACASGSTKGSHVIAALYGPDDARGTVRFSLGRLTGDAEVDRALAVTPVVVERLRALERAS